MPHPRRYRIESLILEALAPIIISELAQEMITLRHITLNRNFSTATVVYTTLGDDNKRTQKKLEALAWRFRRQLTTALNMRKTPELFFVYDTEGLVADKIRTFLETIPGDES
ncbi:MAG: ribosome-binding factor A [Proteobacteria bacterium]|nr:ribosome-binding factor A [Pseudomonadota bacterium]